MSNVYTNLTPGISVESTSVFSAGFAAAKIAPVSVINASGLPDDIFTMSIKIICRHKNETVFSFEREYPLNRCDLYDEKNGGRLIISFDYSDFQINYSFLSELKEGFDTDIVTSFCVGESLYEMRNPISILPYFEFAGIESHPEVLSTFVNPYADEIKAITEKCKKAPTYPSYKDASEIAGDIINSFRTMNIVSVKRDGYSPEKRQSITPACKMFNKSSVVATPLELAVLFCSAIKNAGLDGIIVFVKNVMGVVSVYCGVTTAKDKGFTVSESMTRLRKSLDDGEMLLIDPCVLSSAQNVDIEHAAFLASENMHKASTDMIVAVHTGACARSGIGCIYSDSASSTKAKKDARTVLAEIFNGVQDTNSFKLFGGEYNGLDVIPLVGFTKAMEEKSYTESIRLCPMEISEKISGFRDISDNFASFALKDAKKKEYNKNEMSALTGQYGAFKQRILSKDFAVSGIYEKVFHERASRMCYGTIDGRSCYLVSGFMRLTDAKTGETLYFPLSFVEAELSNSFGYMFKCNEHAVTVNAVLNCLLEGSENALIQLDSTEKAFEYFESLRASALKGGEYSEATVLREYALVKADLSDFILWNDVRRNGKRMLAGGNFAKIAAGEKCIYGENKDDGFTFPLFVPSETRSAILNSGNIIVEGDSVKEKTDIAVNKALYTASKGEKLIVSSNKAFNDELFDELEKQGLEELMLRLDGGMTSQELCEIIKKRVDSVADTVVNPSSDIVTDYDKIYSRIREYSKALSVQDPVLGITLPEAVLSYFRACDAQDGTEIKALKVKPEAFADMTQHKFNVLFDRASKLVETAERAYAAADMTKSEPLNKHPLYPIKEKCAVREEALGELFDIISAINGVISDYRDTFHDISDIMGIDIEDIKTLDGLYALNELYKLVISARELDIPEDASGSDITTFADGASKLKAELARAENIEYRLKFFGKEIFEDVDTLLSGYSPSESGQGNFIKKFLVKKNNKDVLLQYVPDENKNEFNQHSVEEIYKLLEEYRHIKASTSVTDTYLGKENSVKLGEMIKSAEQLLEVIYSDIGENKQLLSEKIGKICKFIRLVSEDAALSKKLTYARAKFARVYSDNDCLLGELGKSINADFSRLCFDSGILSYDGIGAYLKELERNLPALDVWNSYLEAKALADEYMPEFAVYLEAKGIREHTDRVLAASLILPAVGYLIDKYDIIKHKKNCDGVKGKYFETAEKAGALSCANTVLSCKQRLKHYTETENLFEMYNDTALSLCAFVNKHKKAILSVFPIVFAPKDKLGFMFGAEQCADVFLAGAFENNESLLLSGVAAAKSVFLIKFTENNGILSKLLYEADCRSCDASYSVYSSDRALGALIGKKVFYGYDENMPAVSLLTVNGNMRRVGDGANPKEAQSCVARAGEIYARLGKSVGIFTLTHGQAAYIKHLLDLECESDKHLAEAVSLGLVRVFEPSAVSFDRFDTVLVSLGAATDQNGSIGWSYGLEGNGSAIPALVGAFNCARENTVIVSSLTLKELTKLRNNSSEAEKLYLAVLCASKGVTVMSASLNEDEKSGLSEMLLYSEKELVGAVGRRKCLAEGYNATTGEFYMYDCDMQGCIEDRLYQAGLLERSGVPLKIKSILDGILEQLEKAE